VLHAGSFVVREGTVELSADHQFSRALNTSPLLTPAPYEEQPVALWVERYIKQT
jgi:hypothetical protein